MSIQFFILRSRFQRRIAALNVANGGGIIKRIMKKRIAFLRISARLSTLQLTLWVICLQRNGDMMKKVIRATPLEDKKIHIVFSDGQSGVFDMTPYIRSDFFKRLENEEYFKKVRIFFSGIGWPEGQDIGPDTIAEDLQ